MTMNLIMREMGAKAACVSFWWDKKGAGAAVTVKDSGNGGEVRRGRRALAGTTFHQVIFGTAGGTAGIDIKGPKTQSKRL
jgi:hypothetical protein